MIAAMKKVSVVTLKSQQDESLHALRDLGVLHVFADHGDTDRGERLREESTAIDRALTTIPAGGHEAAEESPVQGGEAVDQALGIAARSQAISDELAQLADERDRLNRELERFAPWGGIDPERIATLADAGIKVGLYETPRDGADELIAALPHALVISRGKTVVRVVGIATPGETLPEDYDTVPLPTLSTDEMERRVTEARARSEELEGELAQLTKDRPVLLAATKQLSIAFEYVGVLAAMDTEKELAWVTGFIPADRVDTVRQAAAAHGWGVVIRDPDPEEQVPTEIRNPKPIAIIKPVFDLLGTIPGYREMDISFFFLIFFVVFFAMIIGDGGYGLILLVGTIFAATRGKRAGKTPGAGTVLMIVLSSATVAWGAITGNWFGYAPFAKLPVLRDLVIPSISIDNEASTQAIQYMTFVIGTIHLSIAHVWNFLRSVRLKPRIAALEQLGWLSMVLGLYYLVLQLVLDPALYPMPDFALPMVVGGFAAVVIFGQQESGTNFFVGVGKGFANLITTALDGISAFSDIISYIRLFAVGLASLAIAEAFNSMAGGIDASLGGAGGAVAAGLVLFLGHSLNLAMGALSVVVHGVRLNMLEFSGHLGMEWTGVEYSPFRTRS
jgi:V/A-type H+/Na+-transporting ATPase subunit I